MSIINDALKKTQARLEEKKSQKELSPSEPPVTKDSTNSNEHSEASQETSSLSGQTTSESQSNVTSQKPPIRKTLATIEKEELERKSHMQSLQSQRTTAAKSTYGKRSSLKVVVILFLICFLILGGLYIALSKNQSHFLSSLFLKIKKWKFPGQKSTQVIVVFSPSNPTSALATAVAKASPLSKDSSSKTKTDLPPPAPSLNLKGIITIHKKQFAIINDEVYEEGSMILGKKIVKIATDYVDLQEGTGGQITTLHIPPKSPKP